MRLRLICEWVGAVGGGALSRVFFPHEPGLTFLLYGGTGGLIGRLIVLGCWCSWKELS
jgi:hypothetical protein